MRILRLRSPLIARASSGCAQHRSSQPRRRGDVAIQLAHPAAQCDGALDQLEKHGGEDKLEISNELGADDAASKLVREVVLAAARESCLKPALQAVRPCVARAVLLLG